MKYIDLQNIEIIQNEFRWKIQDQYYGMHYIPFSKSLNILVGPNNSRKSRFLRTLINQENIIVANQKLNVYTNDLKSYISKLKETGEFKNITTSNSGLTLQSLKRRNIKKNQPVIDFFTARGKNISQNLKIKEFEEIVSLLEASWNLRSDKDFREANQKSRPLIDVINLGENYTIFTDDNYNYSSNFRLAYNERTVSSSHQLNSLLFEIRDKLVEIESLKPQFLKPTFTYVPTLRGTVNLILKNEEGQEIDTSNIYETTIRTNYQINENVKIFTGLDLYKRIKKARNSPRNIRKKFEEFETFISDSFFGGNLIDIIALEDKKAIQVYLEETNEDRKMYDLGDGIQSIVNIMYPLFVAEENEWIIIEEPEINLHPKLQTLFLNALLSNSYLNSKNLNIFISTHSNFLLDHLLIFSNKVSATKFYKDQNIEEDITIAESILKNDLSFLDDLGVKNSSVFMSNCTVWVEGITDRIYIKSYLEAYIKENNLPPLKENYDYSFIEYAGSNLKHYIFDYDYIDSESIISRFISNRIFLIADTDEGKEEKHKKLKSLETTYFSYEETGAVEIENILSRESVIMILENLGVQKSSTSRMTIDEKDYELERMGNYLVKKLKGKVAKIPKIKAKSGTLEDRYKKRFAELISASIKLGELSWTNLSTNKHCKKLLENLYKYISTQSINAA